MHEQLVGRSDQRQRGQAEVASGDRPLPCQQLALPADDLGEHDHHLAPVGLQVRAHANRFQEADAGPPGVIQHRVHKAPIPARARAFAIAVEPPEGGCT